MLAYLFVLEKPMGTERLEPIGAPDVSACQLVDMFTACTHAAVKNDILESFCAADGVLRVVVATVAFGMGLDCPNVRRIIHWGPSNDIELYIQVLKYNKNIMIASR